MIDANAKPLTGDDDRPASQRQAEALAEVCGFVLDHGELPECGGGRPHLNVLIGLEDLENRARSAMLDFGGTLSPESLRLLACDCAVIPIVMNGVGQPLDVGRIRRTIPDGLRRAVAARDRGCAHPGCGRPPSWCEVHHAHPWQDGGETVLHNCVMLCKAHHRLLHADSGWHVRIRDGLPEFTPPPGSTRGEDPAANPCTTSSPDSQARRVVVAAVTGTQELPVGHDDRAASCRRCHCSRPHVTEARWRGGAPGDRTCRHLIHEIPLRLCPRRSVVRPSLACRGCSIVAGN